MSTHLCHIPLNALPLVLEAGYGLAVKPVCHMDRTAPFYVLIYLLRGSMEIIEDGRPYLLTPGTLFFLRQGVHHWGEKPFEAGSAWYYVHFECPEPEENTSAYEVRADAQSEHPAYASECFRQFITLPKRLQRPADAALEASLGRLVDLCKKGHLPQMNLLFYEILLHFAQGLPSATAGGLADPRTLRVISFMQAHLLTGFTAGELEAHMGLSYKHIGTLFKEKTGQTLKAYLLGLRMERAGMLLLETDAPVAQVASEAGFADPFYFSRMFRQQKGCSPKTFRDSYVPRI